MELPSEFNYEIHIKWMQNYLKGTEWQIRQHAERKESWQNKHQYAFSSPMQGITGFGNSCPSWEGYGVWRWVGFCTKELGELRTCWQYCSYVSWMHQAMLA